jgi:hypothetical protein
VPCSADVVGEPPVGQGPGKLQGPDHQRVDAERVFARADSGPCGASATKLDAGQGHEVEAWREPWAEKLGEWTHRVTSSKGDPPYIEWATGSAQPMPALGER